jgi:AAA ATPase domain
MAHQVTTGRLVGRTEELAQLRELLVRATTGEAPLVALLGGEAGVGKIRLVEQLAAAADRIGAVAARGQRRHRDHPCKDPAAHAHLPIRSIWRRMVPGCCATIGPPGFARPGLMVAAGVGSARRLVVVFRGSPRGRTVIPRR